MVTRAVSEALPPPPIPSILGKRSRRPSVRFADPVVDLIPQTRVRATPTKQAPRVKPRASSRRPSKLETAPSALAPPGTVPGAAAPAEPFDWDISLLQKEYASDPWFSVEKNTKPLVFKSRPLKSYIFGPVSFLKK